MPEGSRRRCWLPQGGGSGLHGARPVQLVFREELPLPRRWVTGLGGVSAPVTPQREPDHRRSSALGATGVLLGQASPLSFPRPRWAPAAGFGAEGSGFGSSSSSWQLSDTGLTRQPRGVGTHRPRPAPPLERLELFLLSLQEYTCPRCESGFIEEVTEDSR